MIKKDKNKTLKRMSCKGKRMSYRGANYIVIDTAFTLNDDEYYVCVELDINTNRKALIPADSSEVHFID